MIGEPSGWKKIRRGPSELDVRTDSVPSKALPSESTSTAATAMVFEAAECPNMLPAVACSNRPSTALKRK